MDVKTTFLHGDLEEQIYMEQPDGFTQPGHEHLVCKLKKSLYGLKQSPRQWYKRFDSYILQIYYKQCNMYDVLTLKAMLSQEFDMKDLGATTKILGMEIHRDRGSRKLWLSQRGYVEKVLDRFEMSKAKSVSTPLENHFNLSIEQYPKTDPEVGDMAKVPICHCSRLYAMVCARPDLAHAVSQVYKYMFKPGRHHWEVVKWIFRKRAYLLEINSSSIVALSTTEAEYMAVAEAAKEALWLSELSKELGVEQGGV
ncbi:Retrovirus-related Pol polyprotein from transposon TNT 1-94 [Sesamum angolense]|uniref:Retrovirus-related Pol polyprotein from transposon TNT 1-94 n=1 Tax=Sesamum angolense TaxID=2727404 RepID=A0AAE1T5P9_9LAMI|nr:Retrovirus-related Pol polyprotein from transposon TNT 1-94 [Sesamum angolense]